MKVDEWSGSVVKGVSCKQDATGSNSTIFVVKINLKYRKENVTQWDSIQGHWCGAH